MSLTKQGWLLHRSRAHAWFVCDEHKVAPPPPPICCTLLPFELHMCARSHSNAHLPSPSPPQLCCFNGQPTASEALPDCIVRFFEASDEVMKDESDDDSLGFKLCISGGPPLTFRARTASDMQEWVHCT